MQRHHDQIARIGADVSAAQTIDDVLRLAPEIAFNVGKRPVALATFVNPDKPAQGIDVTRGEAGRPIVVPGKFAIVREDNGAPLGPVVGPTFTPLQIRDALAPIDTMVRRGVLQYDRAAAMHGGARVFVRATLPNVAAIPVGKPTAGDLLRADVSITHGHGDGTGIHVVFAEELVVCDNGARVYALNAKRVRHSADCADNVAQAVFDVAPIQDALRRDADMWSALTEIYPETDESVIDYLGAVFREDRSETATGHRIRAIGELYGEPGRRGKVGTMIGGELATRRGTMWGLFQALSQYYTHHAGRSVETRTESRVWGAGADIIARGIDVAYAMGRMNVAPDDLRRMDNTALAAHVAAHAAA